MINQYWCHPYFDVILACGKSLLRQCASSLKLYIPLIAKCNGVRKGSVDPKKIFGIKGVSVLIPDVMVDRSQLCKTKKS